MFESHGSSAEPPIKPDSHSHDKLFKNVFSAFFKDLVEMVHPEVAEALDLERVVFRTEPLFGHFGKGDHRIPDLVGSAPLKGADGERVVIVHLEIEAQHRATMERRMWRYFNFLTSRYDTEVFSVVVFLSGGPSGVEPRRYRSLIGKVEVNRFTYWAFGLSSCDAEEWLQKPQLLAKALAAMMKVRGDRVAHKLRCLRAAAAEKDFERRYLLSMVIDLYLKLRKDEQIRYEAALAEEKSMLPDIPHWVPLSYDEFLEQQEKRQAEIRNAVAEGKKLGLAEAAAKSIAEQVVRQLGRRFGAVPESLRLQVLAIGDAARLQEILDTAFDASSISQVEAAIAGG